MSNNRINAQDMVVKKDDVDVVFNFRTLLLGNSIVDAENVSHDTRPDYPPVSVNAEYGNYLVNVSGCRECHGSNLSGGKNADPASMIAPNITPGSELIAWQTADFINALRTGITPFGHEMDPAQMP